MMKAMILAAGKGERLRPMTLKTPKPLIRAGEHRLIEYHLYRLAKAGVQDVFINTCYHAEQIQAALGEGERYGLKIHYSVEHEGLLGTGGGIYNVLDALGKEPFLLFSGDVWTDYPVEQLMQQNPEKAHLILVKNPTYKTRGDFGLDTSGRINLDPPLYTYASFSVLNPRLFDGCQPGAFSLVSPLLEAIRRGEVTGELYNDLWFNVGDLTELEKLRALLATVEAH